MAGGAVSEELLAQLHPLEVKALPHLKDGITLAQLATAAGMQEAEATRALQWLENKGALSTTTTAQHELTLDANGTKALTNGLPEQRFLAALQHGAATPEEIRTRANLDPQEYGVSVGLLKKESLIDLTDGMPTLSKKGAAHSADKHPATALLKKLANGVILESLTKAEQALVAQLRARKAYLVVKERKERTITLTDLGKALAKTDIAAHAFADRLTKEDLESGAWKDKRYRSFDVTVRVPGVPHGRAHFVQEAIDAVRRIWIEMGFEEMDGAFVQTAFWDLDALFVPQDHPAREVQDTFYLKYPSVGTIDRATLDRVRETHETGGNTGSTGWRLPYSTKEAQRLMLRTHTTVLSAQTIAAIRNGGAKMPGKYFTVGKVFRNEKLDWKHLFEFHQVEGIVVDRNVTFAQLIGYLQVFFAKMGYPKVRCRPHHFPYTEPSVEVDVWHPVRQQWIELGGAGVFRPEVTKALIGEEVPVLAWGLGLERIIVDFFGLKDLREMYANDVAQLERMPRFRVGPW